MNITVKPRPEVLAHFNQFCAVLSGHHCEATPGIEKLINAGLVEYSSGADSYRLTAAGEALRAAEED